MSISKNLRIFHYFSTVRNCYKSMLEVSYNLKYGDLQKTTLKKSLVLLKTLYISVYCDLNIIRHISTTVYIADRYTLQMAMQGYIWRQNLLINSNAIKTLFRITSILVCRVFCIIM